MAANVPPVPVPPAPPALTVLHGMISCGLSNVVQANVGSSPAQRVATQIFFDDFSMCLTLTDKEIDNNFKSFADLPIAEGRIKVMPGIIKMVKAFTQHVAHITRLQLNPEEQPFVPYYGPKLDHSLINPNQVRSYGIGFWDNPYDREKGLKIDLDESTIYLHSKGTKIFFDSRAPTDIELATCPRIDMTSQNSWNPSEVKLQAISSASPRPTIWLSAVQTDFEMRYEYLDPTSDEAILHSMAPSSVNLREQLQKNLHQDRDISQTTTNEDNRLDDLPMRQTYTSSERHKLATAETLADRFGIGLQRARDTLNATRQRGVRSAILPISRRYRADRMFNTKQLRGKFATDTLWAKKRSLNGNICSQIFTHMRSFSSFSTDRYTSSPFASFFVTWIILSIRCFLRLPSILPFGCHWINGSSPFEW